MGAVRVVMWWSEISESDSQRHPADRYLTTDRSGADHGYHFTWRVVTRFQLSNDIGRFGARVRRACAGSYI